MAFASIVSHLEEILGSIIEENLDNFNENDDFFIETDYGNNSYQLDEIDDSEDLCLQGLVHYILLEESLYARFLNDQQLSYVKFMAEESPYYIYSPDPNSSEGNPEEVIQELKAKDLIEEIHHRAIQFVAHTLLNEGFDVPVLEEYLEESSDEE